MLYNIERRKDAQYECCYFYQSKNEQRQIILCEGYLYNNNTFNFSFCIKNKRKFDFPENQITGKDGIKSLIWAYRCLLDFINFLKVYYKGYNLIIYGDTQQKRKIYKKYLLPLGFTVKQGKIQELTLKIYD